MVYSIKKLAYIDVLNILKDCENSFDPPLSQNIPYTVEEYAIKLSNNASFVVCEEEGEIIGFTAFYTNIEGGFFYIPQIWVSDKHQRKGIGAKMMEQLIAADAPVNVGTIRLEVRKNNAKAVTFYKKIGFKILDDNGRKVLLAKEIK